MSQWSPRVTRTLVAGVAVFALNTRAHADMGLIGRGAADVDALDTFRSITQEPTRARSFDGDLDALLVHARESWADELVIVADLARATIVVVRPSDGTIVERTLDRRAIRSSYAVARALVELVEVAREAPPAVSAALPRPARAPPTRRLFFTSDAGWTLISGIADANVLSGPSASVGLRIVSSSTRFGAIALRGLPTLQSSHRVANLRTTYQRTDLSLEGAWGRLLGRAAISLLAEATLSRIAIDARDASESESHRRVALWLGLGGDVRIDFRRAFFRLAVLLGALPSARLVRVRATDLFDESIWQVKTSLFIGGRFG